MLPPGASAVVSLRISAALPPPGQSSAVRSIPSSLRSLGLATLRGAPGFVLTPAMRTAGLVVTPPAGATLSGAVEVSPAGALVFGAAAPSPNGGTDVWLPVAVGTAGGGAAHYVGRARATLLFSDGSVASAHFFCTAALPSLLASLRSFLGSRAWFDDQADPFGRAFSYMDFDAQADWPAMQARGEGAEKAAAGERAVQPCRSPPSLQDPRVYAVGLSDEAGAGSGLAMAVALGAGGDAAGPDPVQVAQLATCE